MILLEILLFKEVELKLFPIKNWNENWNYFKNCNWNRTEIEDVRTEIEVEWKLFPEVKYHW